jgi:hypothetical protein
LKSSFNKFKNFKIFLPKDTLTKVIIIGTIENKIILKNKVKPVEIQSSTEDK